MLAPKAIFRVANLLVLVLLGRLSMPAAATTCRPCRAVHTCAPRVCCVDCASTRPEADLRLAVARANACAGQRGFRRTIRFAGDGPCTIPLAMTLRQAVCRRDALTGGRGSICLTGHDITIDGENKVTFDYVGAVPCQDCAGNCGGEQPALFTLRGRANTLENFAYRYFPSGIHVREGSKHVVRSLTDDRICEHAIDVDSRLPKHTGRGAGKGIQVEDNVFVGGTLPDPGRACLDARGRPDRCGLDKAIQVNGGEVTIARNRIDTIGQPVGIIGGIGTHTIADNRTTGDPTDQNVCQAYSLSGPGTRALFTGNVIDHCKFGVRVEDGAIAEVNDNTITDAYVSALYVRAGRHGGNLVKAAGNRIRHAGFFDTFQCQVGAIVDLDDPGARLDLGGGDFAGMPVIGGVSLGGNVLCESGLTAVWNRTDGCAGTGGGSIGLRDGCVDILPPLVQDGAPLTTAVDAMRACAPEECAF